MPQFKAGGFIKGVRGTEDVSYQRPLSLDPEVAVW
jgi:hypothetical protein